MLVVLQRLQFLVDAVLDNKMNDEDFKELIDAKDVTEDLLFHAAVSSQIDADDVQDQFLVNAVLNNMTSDEDFEWLINAKDVTEDLLFHAVVSSQIDTDDAQDQFLIDAVLDNMISDKDFKELINAEDAIKDLLFHAAVSSQIDADDVRDHDEIEFNVVTFEKDDHNLHDWIIAKCDDDVIASFLTHFVVIIDKDSVMLLKEMIQHFHAVLQLTCSQVRKLMTWWELTACETEWKWWSSCLTSSSITAQSASASSSFSKIKELSYWNWFIWDLVRNLCECVRKFFHCL